MKHLRTIFLAGGGLWVCFLSGCTSPPEDLYAQLQHEDPSVRNQGIALAGRTKDRRAVPYLVDRLTDSQEDVRFFAILALERITGQTMGYRYYEPPPKRLEAVRCWRKWLGEEYESATTAQAAEEE